MEKWLAGQNSVYQMPTLGASAPSSKKYVEIIKMSHKETCKALARSTGKRCRAKGLSNGRCKNHGGLSTGPRTLEGRLKIAKATKHRMLNGQAELAKQGFQRWLSNGGRERLSRQAIKRNQFKRMRTLY